MKFSLRDTLLCLLSILLLSQCAKKGSPSGGPRDTIPPIILKSSPENFTTGFDANEIRVYFDEFIKIKDLQKNLIVSPPLDYQPIITPITSAKILKIKIQDTLKENTTYVFNFGKSIVDNNEENEFDYFTYVFSTGNYIDSLTVKGTVNESLLPNIAAKTTILLYEINEAFTDSIIYKEKPTYITTTKEAQLDFELTNIKEGDYLLIALQEESNDYIFDPSRDKIAFYSEKISVPTDSSYQLYLFKESQDFMFTRASQINKNKIAFGFQGALEPYTIKPLFESPADFETKIIKDTQKDSLNYWFKPPFDPEVLDTLQFEVSYTAITDTLIVRMKDLYADSLQIKQINRGAIIPRDTIKLSATTPIIATNPELIEVFDKDTLAIAQKTVIDTLKNEIAILFEKKDEQTYRINALPGAFEDFYGNQSDTLQFAYRSLPLSDYGTLQLNLQGVNKYPIIIELLDEKFNIKASKNSMERTPVLFDYLSPGNYYLRIIYDTNNNGVWDTGNFLKQIQPERVQFYPETIEIRANWDLNETFVFE